MKRSVKAYLARIGSKGGRKSRRVLTREQARRMVAIREAQKAYDTYHAQCFWSYNKEAKLGFNDIDWVAQTLMNEGDRAAFEKARELKRLVRDR